MAKHRNGDPGDPKTKAQLKAALAARRNADARTEQRADLAKAVRLMAEADRRRRQRIARQKYAARKAAKGT